LKRLLIVEDDDVSREVLSLLATQAGFEVTSAESGDAALQMLVEGMVPEPEISRIPDAILTDLQMPGTSGGELALAFRATCGPRTRLIAMSASGNGAPGYDAFLKKPFPMQELKTIVEGFTDPAMIPELNEEIFLNLNAAMGKAERKELYAMCLADAERRVIRMRKAVAEGDNTTYVKEAHALKGGCGIVGALELHALAGEMEGTGLVDGVDSGIALGSLEGFLAACDRLRRILDAHD
jgi:CheY-like chemotaxis protein